MNDDQFITNDQLIAKTAIALLDEKTVVKGFNMERWASLDTLARSHEFRLRENGSHPCLTSCCVLGHAAMIRYNLDPMSYYVFDTVVCQAQGLSGLFPYFIWASSWNDDREQAATRILFYLEKYPIVDQFDGSEYPYYTVPSDLRERLEKFLP